MRLEPLTDYLKESGRDRVKLGLAEIEAIIGEPLLPSAWNHRTFWANSERNLYARAWMDAGYRVTTRGLPSDEIAFERLGAPVRDTSRTLTAVYADADLILLGCVSQKLDHAAPARDLYTSDLWKKRRAYAEASGKPWLVLSAKYGLVEPDQLIDTYDVRIEQRPADERRAWGRAVVRELRERLGGDLEGQVIEIHAGEQYLEPIRTHMQLEGAIIGRPLHGLTFGQQLAWYADRGFGGHAASGSASAAPTREYRQRIPAPSFEPVSHERKLAVAHALIAHEVATNGPFERRSGPLTDDSEADRYVHEDDFAFLLAVIFDQGIGYGRAWRAPLDLRNRLGHLDPRRMLGEPEAVTSAVGVRPALHRYVNKMPRWVVSAATRVVDEYGGDAGGIWAGAPRAVVLRDRLNAFMGISQKKAAMTVMLLWRTRGIEVGEMSGCDVAVDVHIRRVFLRSGLVERDDAVAIIRSARELNPELPGALDPPAWDVGRNWCHPQVPDCGPCPVGNACPQLSDRAVGVRGG